MPPLNVLISQAEKHAPEQARQFFKTIGLGREVDIIMGSIKRWRVGLNSPEQPIGSYLLCGPTGCGKTHTAYHISYVLHGEKKLLRIDCAEYVQDHEVARLIGAPPGYIGHQDSKPVFSSQNIAQYASPQSPVVVVLLDEIEKASDTFINIFLGILDYAYVQLGTGERVKLNNCLFLFTSNIGQQHKQAGILKKEEWRRQTAIAEIRSRLPAEFLNRLDDIITYDQISPEQALSIADLELECFKERLRTNRNIAIDFELSDEARRKILIDGYSHAYGARFMKNLIRRTIGLEIADKLADASPGKFCLRIDVDDENRFLYRWI